MKFKKESDIVNYNLVNVRNQITPNYDLSNKEVHFELYISHEEKICIIGKLDNNYICWCSITALDDKETNMKIFNYLASTQLDRYSQEYLVLGSTKYNEIMNWYKCNIVKASIEGMSWSTPFGHYYGQDKENHGRYFASDLISYYKEQQDKCEFRVNDGVYIEILKNFLSLLTKDKDNNYMYYMKMKPLISIIEGEAYLKLSPNETVRDLYLKCLKECGRLYNRYMNVVR